MLPTAVVRGRKNPLYLLFATRLRRARTAQRLSASALSQAAGMSRGSVAFLEAGERLPRLSSVERLARVLNVSPGWLAFGLDNAAEPLQNENAHCAGLSRRVLDTQAALGLGNKDLGRRAELSPPEIRALQSGTMPTIDRAERLAAALAVSPAWLAFGLGPIKLHSRKRTSAAVKSPLPTGAHQEHVE